MLIGTQDRAAGDDAASQRSWEHAVTDPEGTAQDASAASAPAAFQTPVTARDLVSEHNPAIGQAPAIVAPRRRWRVSKRALPSAAVRE
jgi:hypothetical protein